MVKLIGPLDTGGVRIKRIYNQMQGCNLSLGENIDLKTHTLALHQKQYACNICTKIFNMSLDYDYTCMHDAKTNVKCEVCNHTFDMFQR